MVGWDRLPELATGEPSALPAWAESLAPTLPRTPAAMLALDSLHRTRSPLDPALRATLRWQAASTNRCVYGMAYALADLQRVGASPTEIEAIASGHAPWPEERTFARKLSREAYKVTDEEVAVLRER